MSNLLAQGQERFNTPLAGYTQEQSCNKLEFATGQNTGGQKRAMDVVPYGLYSLSTGNSVAAGSTQRIIKKVAHGARKNDVLVFTSGNNAGIAIQILSCPDADTMILAATPEQATAVADTFDLKRYVAPLYNSDGSTSAGVPVGGATEAKQDAQIALATKQISEKLFFDYTGVSNAGYTEIITATAFAIKSMTWFESSGQPMVVAIGAAGVEVDLFNVPPGGFNGEIPMNIPAGSRVSIKELVSTALSSGVMIVANFYK